MGFPLDSCRTVQHTGGSFFVSDTTLNKPTPTTITRTPEEILNRSGQEIPALLLPRPDQVFAERALRLRQLAAGHAMRDYLMLLAVVCEAQHTQAQGGLHVPAPTAAQCEAAAQAGEPALDAVHWPRDAQWRSQLRALLVQVLDKLPADSPARTVVQQAAALDDDTLEQQANRLLAGITLGLDMATAPLVAAGLQLYFTQLAAAAGAALLPHHAPGKHSPRCPCCGSLPVASITRLGGSQEGQRYLHCTLCNTQWHMNRVQCTHCGATDGIQYQSLQAVQSDGKPLQRPSIEAETCDACHHYLKVVHMAQDLHVEPLADDLASLTLDLLVSETGMQRHGTNLLLLFGEAEEEAQEADTGVH
ncbi:formate dehydrogenase accessory protein FdhE [Comamonas faecalis]|uniref:Protein FdhE homolog n=1 Tax=Comamonas faecalis TaxID=1387849 RepID=A0ABP7RSP7_9BURK